MERKEKKRKDGKGKYENMDRLVLRPQIGIWG